MSSTVLIAASDLLPSLKERDDFGDALAFSDAEALRALEVITRQRPSVVAVERLFAASSRGAALINRIKADPALSGCEIRIVSHDSSPARVPARRVGEPTSAAPAAVAEAPPVAPLDQRGTRRAPRFRVIEGIELLVDGNPATLVDLSVFGAQVVSTTILKPNQRIRLWLPDPVRPMRFGAGVAWASFEMPKGGARYRAGIEFFEADADALGQFLDENKK